MKRYIWTCLLRSFYCPRLHWHNRTTISKGKGKRSEPWKWPTSLKTPANPQWGRAVGRFTMNSKRSATTWKWTCRDKGWRKNPISHWWPMKKWIGSSRIGLRWRKDPGTEEGILRGIQGSAPGLRKFSVYMKPRTALKDYCWSIAGRPATGFQPEWYRLIRPV